MTARSSIGNHGFYRTQLERLEWLRTFARIRENEDMPNIEPYLIVIRSTNMDRAVQFYKMLGLTFLKHRHGTGQEHFAAESGSFVFEIYPQRPNQASSTGTRLGFRLSEIDTVVANLAANGISIISPLTNSTWGRRAVVEDFDGHRVELLEM